MRREDKYQDTPTFKYYNANPKNRITTDCVVRAICTALMIPYNQVVMEMAKLQCDTGYDESENRLIDKYLTSKGWKKCNQPRKTNNKKYTGIEFCSYLKELNKSSIYKRYNRVVANIGGHHIVAIIDYKVNDTWNSTMGSIGTYWIKEK